MGIFPKAKGQDELILVFNIGSGVVGGALFWAQKSGIPKIIFSTEETIQIEKEMDIDKFLSLTVQSLEVVVNKVFMAKLGVPSRVFCTLSSPWYFSQTRIINLEKNTSFVFSAKLADELVKKEIKLFEEEHSAKYKNEDNKVRTIELKNIKTVLNGYETTKPLNQKAKELEMTIFISTSGEQILKKMEDIIGKHFYSKQIKFSSFTVASFAVVRDLLPSRENFLLVDIGGEVTDIAMIKNNILHESISFPLGRNFLIRRVAGSLGCTLNEASSLISLFKDGHAEETTTRKLTLIVDKLKTEWLKKFQESLANLSHDISIPATIYLATDKELADFFSETIKTEQFSQYTLTESKFEIILLNTQMLHGIAEFEESVIREPYLIIDSIYINRFLVKI